MPVNAGVFNALAQPVRSVNDYLADYDARDDRKLTRQHNALALQQQQATMADQERTRADGLTVRNALAALGPGATLPQRAAALRGTNLPAGYTQADALEKALREQQTHEADLANKRSTNATREFENKRKAFEYGVQGLQVAQTPEQAAELFNQGVQAGHWPMQFAQFHLKSMPADPAGFARWRVQQLAQITDAKDQLPKQVSEDMGGSRMLGTRDPFTGALTVNSAMPKTQTPDNAASNARMAADAAASRAQSDRHFNTRLGYDKEKDAAKADAPPKPLPPAALKMQQESLDAIGVAGSINADLGSVEEQIKSGKLKFGPISNLANSSLNMAGMSTEESRNFSSFNSTLERLRNESLRLNTGVQTDGDAQRAWNELFQNINDTGLVQQRLKEIQGINRRGAELHRLRVDSVRGNYGAPQLDSSAYGKQPAAVGTAGKTVKRTGTSNGRKVVEYSDGSIEYAD